MKSLLAAAAVLAIVPLAGHAFADDFVPKAKGRWVVDLRVTDVSPSHQSAIVTAAGAPTGLDVKVSDSVMPTLGITYFVTDHIAVEVIAGTTQHTVKAAGAGMEAEVYKTWVLPPVISAQYHFRPKARFSPYVGTGPNAMLFYGGSNRNGYSVKLPSGFGWAAQVGADYAIKGGWALNADLKKVWYETDAKVDGGVLRSKVNLDPWVASVGFGYRF